MKARSGFGLSRRPKTGCGRNLVCSWGGRGSQCVCRDPVESVTRPPLTLAFAIPGNKLRQNNYFLHQESAWITHVRRRIPLVQQLSQPSDLDLRFFWWEMQKPQNYIRFSPKSRVENKTERLRLIFQCPGVHWKIRRIRSVFSSTPISDGKRNCFCESCIHKLKNLRSRVAGCTNRSILRIPSVLERKVVSK